MGASPTATATSTAATTTATATPTPSPIATLTPVPNGLDIGPSPRLLDFKLVGIQESATKNLVLRNKTASAITGSVTLSAPYSINPTTVNIAAKKTQKFTVTFAPTSLGKQNALANFTFIGDPNEPALQMPITGEGAPGHLVPQPKLVNFGHPKNPKPAQLTRTEKLVNNGKGMLTINVGALVSPFVVSPTGPQTIAPKGKLPLVITYSGTSSTQTLTITTDNPDQPTVPITVEGAIATAVTATSSDATSSAPLLFAGHGLAAMMMGPAITAKSQALSATVQAYDPEADSFEKVGKMNNPRVGASTTVLSNGTILIAGGGSCIESADHTRSCSPTNTAQLYDPAARKFRNAGTGSNGHMNSARMGHSATLISGCGCALEGDVLLAGGNSGVESVSAEKATSDVVPLQSAELYDPRDDSFIALPNPMVMAREEAIAVALPNTGGKILLAGGDSKGIFQNSIADAEIFDPVAQSFSATAPMSLSRELASAVALDPRSVSGRLAGDVLVTGGLSTVGNLAGSSLSSAELYDPVAGTWTTIATAMESPRALHSMTLLTSGSSASGSSEGSVLVLGGVVLQGTGGLSNLLRSSVASAELFSPVDGTFSKASNMSAARSAHSAVVLNSGPNSGDVLVAGGQQCTGPECDPSDSAAELYDPATGKWNPSKATLSPSLGAVLGDVVPLP